MGNPNSSNHNHKCNCGRVAFYKYLNEYLCRKCGPKTIPNFKTIFNKVKNK